jgi:hypothetical protein
MKLGKDPSCVFGKEDPDIRRLMRLKMERRLKIYGKVFETGVVKRATGMSIRLRIVQDWRRWKGRPPPKRKRGDRQSRSR